MVCLFVFVSLVVITIIVITMLRNRRVAVGSVNVTLLGWLVGWLVGWLCEAIGGKAGVKSSYRFCSSVEEEAVVVAAAAFDRSFMYMMILSRSQL